MTEKILQALKWRYATKKFDSSKSIKDDKLEALKESIRMSPSSYGLQAFKLIHVVDKDLRLKLQAAAHNQTAVGDCSNFFVLAAQTKILPEEIQSHMNKLAQAKGVDQQEMSGYGNFVKSSVAGMSADKLLTWNQKQCYIALGMLLETAALLEVDSLPMEGFDANKFDEILELEKLGLSATVCCALGYRSSADENQHFLKVRKDFSDFEITY